MCAAEDRAVSALPGLYARVEQGRLATAVVFILTIIIVRAVVRVVLAQGGRFYLEAPAISDMLIALVLGLFTAQRMAIHLSAKRLLDETRRFNSVA